MWPLQSSAAGEDGTGAAAAVEGYATSQSARGEYGGTMAWTSGDGQQNEVRGRGVEGRLIQAGMTRERDQRVEKKLTEVVSRSTLTKHSAETFSLTLTNR